MLRIALVALLFSGFCFAESLPLEEKVEVFALQDGHVLYLHEMAHCPGKASVRLIPKDKSAIYEVELDWQKAFTFEGESDRVPPMDVVVVGECFKDRIAGLLPLLFKESMPVAVASGYPVSISYPTTFQSLQTIGDLCQRWLISLVQSMFQTRLTKAVEEIGIEVEVDKPYFLLPAQTAARIFCEQDECIDSLETVLLEVAKIKQEGFTHHEFHTAKTGLQKKVQKLYAESFLSKTDQLASYYADQLFHNGSTYSYPFVLMTSLNLLDAFSFLEIKQASDRILKDEIRDIDIDASFAIADEEIDEILGKAALVEKNPLPVDGHEDGFNTYDLLHASDADIKNITKIITSMATNNLLELAFMKGSLESKGKKIHHVHPLRFMGTIFSKPELKTCMQEIKKSSFKWDHLIKGFAGRMKEEAGKDNVMRHLPGFCKAVGADPHVVRGYVNKQDYEGLVRALL